MNLLANILIAIVLASTLYAAIFSRPKSPETAPPAHLPARRWRSREARLIADGIKAGWESQGGTRKW